MNSLLSPFSLTSFYDMAEGTPISVNVHFYSAGTLDPITVYKDAALSVSHPDPVVSTGSGRIPPVFIPELANGYRVRVYDATTLVLLEDVDNLPGAEPDPASVPPPTTIDANSLLQTGDIIAVFNNNNTRAGFVRCNGRTIGSATSGATERANADTEALFLHLWQQSTNDVLPVSGGRGASAASDWSANKTIALPDLRGRALIGSDQMGNSASGRLAGVTWTGNIASPGAVGGTSTWTLTTAQIPAHNHTINDPGHTHTASDSGHSHGITDPGHNHVFGSGTSTNSGSYIRTTNSNAATFYTNTSYTGISINTAYANIAVASANTGITTANVGGGTAHPITQPSITMTFYMRL